MKCRNDRMALNNVGYCQPIQLLTANHLQVSDIKANRSAI